MSKRNPKQEGTCLWDCIPQVGPCPLNCNQCFYNRPGAFYVSIDEPHMPTVAEVGDGIVRVNCGHDSNFEREKVITETAKYKHRFFNTSIPDFDFPGPVVWTANPNEEKPAPFIAVRQNIMFIRLRVSSTNLEYIKDAVAYYTYDALRVPVVLTFMAYYDGEPPDKENYVWKTRHINSYWCATPEFQSRVIRQMKAIGGRLVTMCGAPESNWCRDCCNCETYYWQTIKHIKETGL